MFNRVRQNLTRQHKALELLEALLEEEFSHLTERRPEQVTATEFSIHELLRQIALEREDMVRLMSGVKLKEYMGAIEPEKTETLAELVKMVGAAEQRCAIRSERNAELAFALLDQSRAMLGFIHQRVQPKREDVYSARGRYAQGRPEATLLKGRL